MAEVIVKYNGDITKLETELDADVEILFDYYAIITLEESKIPQLYNYTEIEYIEFPTEMTITTRESNLINTCVTSVQSESGYGLLGKGVLIGIIDSGVDYNHKDFINSDGNSKILYIWDQLAVGTPPEGFKSGAEYDNATINRAIKSPNPFDVIPPTDNIGHGTAVAGIAIGVAPEASLIVVRLGERGRMSFARNTEIMRALKYIIDKATTLNMPVAINISFGTNNGSHTGESLFSTYVDSAAVRWKTVIVAATGNEGAAGHHYQGIAKNGETLDVQFTIGAGISTMYITMWKNFIDEFDIELIAPSGKGSGKINATRPLQTINVEGTPITINYGQPQNYTEHQEIFFNFGIEGGHISEGIWKIRIHGNEVKSGLFNIWLPTIEEVGTKTAFSQPDANVTLTLPSTSRKAISVAAYNDSIGTIADFSGRGYVFEDMFVKPDITAPGVGIISSRMGGGYDSFTGTSMAAPFVTGATTLMMEWGIVRGNDRFLYGQRVKAFLKKGAKKYGAIPVPNSLWGYGALCLKNTMDYLVEYKR